MTTRDTWVDRPLVEQRIDDWLNDPEAPRLLVVAGRFGTGKSVVLAQTAERTQADTAAVVVDRLRLRGEGRTLASRDAGGFVTGVRDALRAQLGEPLRKEAAIGSVHVSVEVHAQGSVGSVAAVEGNEVSLAVGIWNGEVVPLLRTAIKAGLHPVLIVDALDELDAALVGALSDRILPELPEGVSALVSGRPKLPGTLAAPGGGRPVVIDLDQSEAADDDIGRYVERRLQASSDLSTARRRKLVDQIVAGANGKFLFARWVLDDVAADPDLNLATWAPPDGMAHLYDGFLARVEQGAGALWPVVAGVLASVAASFDAGLSVGQLADIHGVDITELRRWLKTWCGHYLETDARDRVRVGHASLATHWIDPFQPDDGALGVPAADAHDRLAHWCINRAWDESTPEYAVRNATSHAAIAATVTVDESLQEPRVERVAAIASSWDWLAERYRRHGTGALLGDLKRAGEAVADDGTADGAAPVVSLAQIVRRWAHHLGDLDTTALACQLLVPAVRQHDEQLKALLEGAIENAPGVGLAARWCSPVPEPAFTAVLLGNSVSIQICSVGDGRVASIGDHGTVRLWDPDEPDADAVVLTVPTKTVWALCPVGDGRLASAGLDETIWLSDLVRPDRDPITLVGHAGKVWAMCSVGDGSIATAGRDGTVSVWDLDRPGRDPIELSGHTDSVRGICAVGDGRIATAGDDGTVRVWVPDRPGRDPIVLTGHTDSVHPTIQGLCAFGDGRVATAGDDGTVRVWEPNHPHADPIVFTGHAKAVWAVCPVGDGRLASASLDGTLRVWDPDQPGGDSIVLTGHAGAVWGVCPIGDGRLASSGNDKTLRVWDPDQPSRDGPGVSGHSGPVWGVCAVGDRRIATAGDDSTMRLWDPDHPDAEPVELTGHTGPVRGVCAVGDGRIATAGDDTTVRLWDPDLPDAEPVELTGHTGPVRGVCAIGDGRIATAGDDFLMRLWDPGHPDADPVELRAYGGWVVGLCPLGDNRQVVSAHEDGTVRVWDPNPPGSHRIVLASEDEDTEWGVWPVGAGRIAAAGDDGTIRVCDPDRPSAAPVVLTGQTWTAGVVAVEGGRLVSADYHHGKLRVWDLDPRPVCIVEVGADRPTAVASLGGRYLATGHGDGAVMVWELIGLNLADQEEVGEEQAAAD